jgi:hypothetical protein
MEAETTIEDLASDQNCFCYIETNLNSPSARFAHTQIVQDPMAKAFHFRY